MQGSRKAKPVPGYKVAGESTDGIPILEPKTRPSHFTSREMKSTVETVKRRAKAIADGPESADRS